MSLFNFNHSPISTLRVGLIQALELMTQHDYQPVEDAFREGTIEHQDPETLKRFLLALANQPIPNDTVRHRDIIRGLTINHLLLQHHIDGLNRQNSKTQKWVIALAIAALLSSVVQIFSPIFFRAGAGATVHDQALPTAAPSK